MDDAALLLVLAAGALVSLSVSWVLVTRIERLGARVGLSEALLGLVAALAADTPEISAAVSALAHHQADVGSGVVIGSNVFNLAALLGLGAVVAGRIRLHRRVVLLAGGVGLWVAGVCLLTVLGVLGGVAGLVLAGAGLVPYAVVSGVGPARIRRSRHSRPLGWLQEALAEEELELHETLATPSGGLRDLAAAGVGLVVVVTSSVLVEGAAARLGLRLGVPQVVTGAMVLAGITSLPNAVAAFYLARRGRGTATLSTALNSNALNVVVGFLLPAAVLGADRQSAFSVFVACWYLGLTVAVLAMAYVHEGVSRGGGVLVMAGYVAYAVVLPVDAWRDHLGVYSVTIPPALLGAVMAGWSWRRRCGGGPAR